MKQQLTIALAGGIAMLLCGTGIAETQKGLIDSSKLDGQNITDSHGNQLGHLDSLLLDPVTGTVQYAMIGTGLITDNAEAEVAVPWSAFRLDRSDPNQFRLTLDATKEKLEKAPKLTAGESGALFDQAGSDAIRTYWADPLKVIAADPTVPKVPAEAPSIPSGVGSNPPEFSKGVAKITTN
jgi:sporulation protein YlmC with PRC-barrel domain